MPHKISVFHPKGITRGNRRIVIDTTDGSKGVEIEIYRQRAPVRLEHVGRLGCNISPSDVRDENTLSFRHADALRERIRNRICDEHGNLAIKNDNDAIIFAVLEVF
jgi:hypothetical protein